VRSPSLRARIFAALATVAIVPVAVFGLFAVIQGALLLGAAQDEDLRVIARVASRQLTSETFDASGAQRLAGQTERQVTLFAANGGLVGRAGGAGGVAPPPADLDTAGEPRVVHAGGLATAYVAVVDGARRLGVLAVSQDAASAPPIVPALLATLALTGLLAVFLSFALAQTLVRPLTQLSTTLDRLHAGDLSARLPAEGDDELARLAESHNRLADALASRNRSLAVVLQAVARLSPRDGVPALVATAERVAAEAFGFTSTRVVLTGADASAGAGGHTRLPEPAEERVPGEAYEVRVPIAVGDERLGVLVATRPPTLDWSAADEDLAALFGSQLAAAVRNAELFGATEELSELKSEFLRGVSHNLQTPLTSIRAFAQQLAAEGEDRRLGIIVEQAERLTRLVSQLLTVSKLEAGTLRPQVDVFALAPLVQRAWESLGDGERPFRLVDDATGWLVAADRDWVEQVVWALLDNALKYGGEGRIEVLLAVRDGSLVATVADAGPGIPPSERERVFERFARLGLSGGDGTGLGLSVARGLVEGMGGRLWLEPADGVAGGAAGARFSFSLPAERIEEAD
jgi:signal transduction histidine kinase